MTSKRQQRVPAATEPPVHLSEKSRELWRAIVPARARSAERIAMLTAALVSLDRADQAREVIAAEGMTFTSKRSGAVHVHPALTVEKNSLAAFTRMWSALHLEWNPEVDGRMPRFLA